LSDNGLSDRIQSELKNIDYSVKEAKDAWERFQDENERHFLNSAVFNIHSFYLGLEMIFKNIAKVVEGELPAGSHWHRDLLRQMSSEKKNIRPAVISESTKKQLDEYRKFFHLIRHIYGIDLNPERIKVNVNKLHKVWQQTKVELEVFVNFLKNRK
jgi:hypothetical protein